MKERRFVVMGAGEVGRAVARTLSRDGHAVVVIDTDAEAGRRIEDALDVAFVHGNGSHASVLEAAGVGHAELFVAVSSSDEANLVASRLARQLGPPRSVVRVKTAEDVTRYGRVYEQAFGADLLLSTELLTTTRILNVVLGTNTVAVEYLVGGALQLRRTQVGAGSPMAGRQLSDLRLPRDLLVLARVRDGETTVPTGRVGVQVGDELLVVGSAASIDALERQASRGARRRGPVTIAGGGRTAHTLLAALGEHASRVQVIESDRRRAEAIAAAFPRHEVIHGDAIDPATLASEGVGRARAFVAATGNDETNLMACLLAKELGVEALTALVRKSETSQLWQKVGGVDVVSPRTIAAERIRQYIESGYEPHKVSFENGAASFVQRRVHSQSPVVGNRLRDVEIPEGLLVAAVVSAGEARVPRGSDILEDGDDVLCFVRRSELALAQLLFPGPDADVA